MTDHSSTTAVLEVPSSDPSRPSAPSPRSFEIDLRRHPHSRRRSLVLERLAALEREERLVVVSEYEPRVLRLGLDVWFPGVFAWRWLEREPLNWRAEITRAARPSPLSREPAPTCDCCRSYVAGLQHAARTARRRPR